MKNKKYHTVGTDPKSYRQIEKEENRYPQTHKHTTAHFSGLVLNHRMGVTPEIGTSRSGNLLLQTLIEGKKSYFYCMSSKFSCPRRCSLIGWIIIKLTIFIS
jgi:hypothetical protein